MGIIRHTVLQDNHGDVTLLRLERHNHAASGTAGAQVCDKSRLALPCRMPVDSNATLPHKQWRQNTPGVSG